MGTPQYLEMARDCDAGLFLLEPGSFSQSFGDIVGEVNYSIDQETIPLGKQLIDRVDAPPAELADLREVPKERRSGPARSSWGKESTRNMEKLRLMEEILPNQLIW